MYLPEWESEAEYDQKKLAKRYGIDKSKVHLIEVRNNEDITNAWNGMGTENGETVDIQNVSSTFSKKVSHAPVVASDGTVYSKYPTKFLFWTFGSMKYQSKNDKVFREWRDSCGEDRENMGWLIYENDGSNLNVYATDKKTFDLSDLDDFLSAQDNEPTKSITCME